MFSIELNFNADCLKFWFNKNRKILEVSPEQKKNFFDTSPKNDCCLCDFSLQSRAENGWFKHVCKVEYLFLEKIYTEKEMYQMGIHNFNVYFNRVKKVLDNVDKFCNSIETENRLSIVRKETNNEIKEIVEKIKKINVGKNKKEEVSKEKTMRYLYKNSIKFLPNNKISGDFPLSARFFQNLIYIHKNELVFFLFLKGLIPSVWETTEIFFGGKNPTDVNFAVIQNQVRFINTVKYYQQSLASLAASMIDIEKKSVR